MASTITLYDQLTGATTGGTWTYNSGPLPNPSPPGTYNGVIDFAGFAAGNYEYKYRVTAPGLEHEAFVLVSWTGDGEDRLNEGCETAYNLGSFNVSPFSGVASDDSRGVCVTGLLEPTISGLAIPGEWGSVTYGGDLFYKIKVPSCTVGYTVTVTVSGATYPNPAKGIALQIYTACRENDCGVATRQASAAGNMMQTSISAAILIPAASGQTLYIRVASQMLGQFDVTVSSDFECTNIAPEVCEATTKVMGYGPDFAFGYGPNFVFGA